MNFKEAKEWIFKIFIDVRNEYENEYKGIDEDGFYCFSKILGDMFSIKELELIIFHIKNENAEENDYQKEPIPMSLRWKVWGRDDFTCQICGIRNNLTVDHIRPEVKGGELNINNLQTLCKSCNCKKGSKILDLV